MSMRAKLRGALPLALAMSLLAPSLGGCMQEPRDPSELDLRLETHALEPGTPSTEGLAYVEALASAHERADADAEGGLTALLDALELERPVNDGVAEQMHYELLARAAEQLLARGDSEQALELLEPRLAPSTSLPIDRAAARGLVALGDAAAHTGDLPLAMSSYARALDMLTLLLEEAES